MSEDPMTVPRGTLIQDVLEGERLVGIVSPTDVTRTLERAELRSDGDHHI